MEGRSGDIANKRSEEMNCLELAKCVQRGELHVQMLGSVVRETECFRYDM